MDKNSHEEVYVLLFIVFLAMSMVSFRYDPDRPLNAPSCAFLGAVQYFGYDPDDKRCSRQ